ncbi:MAG: hypothetical protein AABW51_01670 [Nanoarchaeota archaeon]
MLKNNLVSIVRGIEPLYHGSGELGIRVFRKAYDDTIGEGIYLTSDIESAEGYAKLRSQNTKTPVVYSVSVDGLNFLDFREIKTLDIVMASFLEVLTDKLKHAKKWYVVASTKKAIEDIRNKKYIKSGIKEITFSHGDIFSRHIESLGYDGLLALEGGEGKYRKIHDSWVVHNPSKVNFIGERKIV